MLDPRRLRLLRDVASTGTIAAAAELAGCTAAAASQQLAALERDLGAVLLERSARSVRLTEAGRVLADHAGPLLAGIDEAERAVRDVAGLRGGSLRVAAFATAAIGFVVPALTTFRRRHPDVELRFTELESAEALPELRAGTVDLAVTHEYAPLSRPDLRGLDQRPLYREPMLLAVPRKDAPAASGPIDLADFAGAAWVAALTSTGFQAATEMACRAAGFEPRIETRVHSYPMALAMVAAGFGVALVPRLAATGQRGLVHLPIARPTGLVRQIYATTRTADRSPAVRHLSRYLVGALKTAT
ncbi:DNA-binding transcriptional LysR family regulator [Actinoplanes campanulatus]|uniref:DNA-binding transcriptional LysR family regulator n=1 Tax=Actinoplanes campanulatus TaxID=113559 RepID=A0A7W5ADW3_9ACTN|nr:LysR substrate-binding domain-containing protein [Actinoplanes campanulatus]MBB3094267.1 DNA-binding transcriptional LysR family regulator [Actinoplanes campanulatus]GGN19805.1 LysR family transcriptional regulator [Actinoplanes campanulatus]GID35812.1 LysR family transcriptional regulator [Actinoplanes campanulatus]